MATMVFTLEGNPEFIGAKKTALLEAIEERVGILGRQLYDMVEEKLSGTVLERRTGELADSVVERLASVSGVAFEAYTEIPEDSPQHLIGLVHEYGGRDYYPIVPVNAQALSFVVGGVRRFARSVNHPPAQERSFMRSSLDEITEAVYAGLQETVDSVLEAA